MADPASFAKLVPGFDFLQGLMKGAGAGLPAMNQWIAPTLDPDELDKRIGELRTVQFWLEQNAKMIATTIQALEVQRMTLATLKTMNLPMAELRESMTLRPPAPAPEPEPAPAEPAPAPPAAAPHRAPAAEAPAATPVVDPMQWWGALTQQFSTLAAQALKDLPTMPQAAAGAAGAAAKTGHTATPGAAKAAPRARKAPAAKKAARAPARRRAGG